MTTADMTSFLKQRPFVPFALILPNGREIFVPHSDFIGGGHAMLSVYVILPTGQLEIVDTAMVVSIRTFHPAGLPQEEE
jgi:hypothetical protein